MDKKISAQGAPRGGFAHAPTGFRRMTPGLLEGRPRGGRFRRPAGGGQIAGAVAGRPQGGGATAWHFAAPGARRRLAVPLHPAAGLGAGQPADRMALGLDAAGGARPFADAGQGNQPPPDRARPGDDEGQPERQALRPRGTRRPGISSKPTASILRRSPTRHAEFVRLAEEGRAERAAMGRLRRRATIARKAIIQILETAAGIRFRGRGVDHTRPRNSGLSRAR